MIHFRSITVNASHAGATGQRATRHTPGSPTNVVFPLTRKNNGIVQDASTTDHYRTRTTPMIHQPAVRRSHLGDEEGQGKAATHASQPQSPQTAKSGIYKLSFPLNKAT